MAGHNGQDPLEGALTLLCLGLHEAHEKQVKKLMETSLRGRRASTKFPADAKTAGQPRHRLFNPPFWLIYALFLTGAPPITVLYYSSATSLT